jgi:hypothetical protein
MSKKTMTLLIGHHHKLLDLMFLTDRSIYLASSNAFGKLVIYVSKCWTCNYIGAAKIPYCRYCIV